MRIRGLILDLDGTVYLGDRPIPGAPGAVDRVRSAGIDVLFLSNKPIATPEDYARKLTAMGIRAEAADVVNSTAITVSHLSREMPGARVFVIGERPLRRALEVAGFREAQSPAETDLVLVSLDRKLDYAKLHFAHAAVVHGARIWATNPDVLCPIEGDVIVDAGATIAALEATLGRKIDGVAGKPSPITVQTACRRLGVAPECAAVVGDRLETDIAMGLAAGMHTYLVLTGVTTPAALETSPIRPDTVLDSIGDLPLALGLKDRARVG